MGIDSTLVVTRRSTEIREEDTQLQSTDEQPPLWDVART